MIYYCRNPFEIKKEKIDLGKVVSGDYEKLSTTKFSEELKSMCHKLMSLVLTISLFIST
jgi:hypothetical protein